MLAHKSNTDPKIPEKQLIPLSMTLCSQSQIHLTLKKSHTDLTDYIYLLVWDNGYLICISLILHLDSIRSLPTILHAKKCVNIAHPRRLNITVKLR